MDLSDLPDDLGELERRLIRHPRQEASEAFRRQVLAAVMWELDQNHADVARRSLWQFAAMVAVTMLLWINFSMSAANDIDWHLTGSIDSESFAASVSLIEDLAPDLSERDAVRQAWVLHAMSWVVPLPDSRAALVRMLGQRRCLKSECR